MRKLLLALSITAFAALAASSAIAHPCPNGTSHDSSGNKCVDDGSGDGGGGDSGGGGTRGSH